MPSMMPAVQRRTQGTSMNTMRKRGWQWWTLSGIALMAVSMIAVQRHQHRPHDIVTEQLGVLHDYPAWWWQRGMVILFSSGQGWLEDDKAAARAFSHRGYRVLGVDSAVFMSTHRHDASCLYLPGLIEATSRDQQQQSGMKSYQLPALVGHQEGATLAYVAQLQAPPLALSAVVALNPTPLLPLNTPFCDHTLAGTSAGGQTVRAESPGTTAPLRVWVDARANAASEQFAAAINAGLITMMRDDAAPFRSYRAALADVEAESKRSPVADLPLVEVLPQHMQGKAFTIFYSGDGGWRDLDQTLSDVLAHRGMPVVGVDTLNYYWHEKNPQQSAQDLARIIRYYQQQWHRQQVVLVGFSFGANVLPFIYNHLPDDMKNDVVRLSLLSPERTTAFSVDPSAWLHIHRDGGKVAIAPQLMSVPARRVQCIYGREERGDSLCTVPQLSEIQVISKPGGHHFDENYDHLADEVLAGL